APLKVAKAEPSGQATNAIVRVMAFLCDLLLAYTLLTIFMPFDDFSTFLDFIPNQLADLLGIEWATFWNSIMEDHVIIAEILADLYQFIAGAFPVVPLLLMFILVRLGSVLILGVSFSQFLMGVRSTGNFIWA